MSDTTPKGIKITDFPIATDVAPDDFIPVLDSSSGIIKRTVTSHSSRGDEWGLGTDTEYGHVKTVDNLLAKDFNPGEALSAHAGYQITQNFGIVETEEYAKLAHGIGDYFVFNGQFVIATKDIVKNDRLVIGGNILLTDVNAGLKGAKTDISNLQSDVSELQSDVTDIRNNINHHKLETDVIIQDGEYGYMKGDEFVPFKSQADIDAAVAAAMQGDATAADVLSGKTFTNETESGIIGSMPNRGAVSPAGLNAGGSYIIPAGYHNGSGKVTANSLASQTSATAGVGDIKSGQTAWVNGSKLTGTFAAQEKTITPSDSTQTVTPDSGRYLSKVTVNPQSGFHRVKLGSASTNGKTFSVTGYSGYQSFTTNNFAVIVTNCSCHVPFTHAQANPLWGNQENPYSQGNIDEFSKSMSPSLSYTASTGTVKIDNLQGSTTFTVHTRVANSTQSESTASANGTFTIDYTVDVYLLY